MACAYSLCGNGGETSTQYYFMQYIDDLLNGMVLYMDLDEDFPGPVNLGNDSEFSILELAEKVLGVVGGKSELIFEELPGDDPLQRCPDIGLAKERLGWEPVVALDGGLVKTVEYFKSL